MLATKEEILARGARRTDTLDVPGVGKVRARTLAETEKAEYQGSWFAEKTGKFLRTEYRRRKARLIVTAMLNEDDTPYWGPNELEAVAALGDTVIEPLFEALSEFCGVAEAKPTAKTVAELEEAEKNSDAPNASAS